MLIFVLQICYTVITNMDDISKVGVRSSSEPMHGFSISSKQCNGYRKPVGSDNGVCYN